MIKVPKNQKLWVTNNDENGNPKQIITSDQIQSKYFLYNIENDGSLIKIETAFQPIFKKDMFNKK